jgi:hypothetical protein
MIWSFSESRTFLKCQRRWNAGNLTRRRASGAGPGCRFMRGFALTFPFPPTAIIHLPPLPPMRVKQAGFA